MEPGTNKLHQISNRYDEYANYLTCYDEYAKWMDRYFLCNVYQLL
jgi:hypothetical protein